MVLFNERFWSNSSNWPEDAADYTFLPRAISAIQDLLRAEQLTSQGNVNLDAGDAESVEGEDTEEDQEISKTLRRRQAVSYLVSACRSGELLCAVRPKLGGEFTDIRRSVWNSEHYHHWFLFCDFSLASPYDADEWSSKEWLFVKNEGLAKLARPFPSLGLSRASSANFSPYLSLMVTVAEELKITSSSQPKVEELKAEFARRWLEMGMGELSDRLAHGMASLVRNPESQGGRNIKISSPQKKR